MRWLEVQERFPNEWVVLVVMEAHLNNGQRLIEEVVVVDRFDKPIEAMHRYEQLRKEQHNHEDCFFHTSRPNLVTLERYMGFEARGENHYSVMVCPFFLVQT